MNRARRQGQICQCHKRNSIEGFISFIQMQIHERKQKQMRYSKRLTNSHLSPEHLLNSLHHHPPQATIKTIIPDIVKMDTICLENLVNTIPNALMPPEENTIRVTAKGLETTVDLDDTGGAIFIAKAMLAALAANLTNSHMSRTELKQPPCHARRNTSKATMMGDWPPARRCHCHQYGAPQQPET